MAYVLFQSTCPAPNCLNNNYYVWAHHNCGGYLILDNRAILTCSRGDAQDLIFRWRFDCGYRNNRAHECGFESGSLQGFLACLSCLGKLQRPCGNFIIDVTRILMEHQNEMNGAYY